MMTRLTILGILPCRRLALLVSRGRPQPRLRSVLMAG